MADLLTEPTVPDEDTALLDRANQILLGRARSILRARPAPPTVPPARVEPNPAAKLASARALLGEPLPPLQGFTFGRLPSFSEAAGMFTDQFSYQLLSGSRALPPDPAGLAIHSVLPADVIEKFPDSFRSDINQLYQDRGLELPDVKPGDTERFHRWERGYLGHLEQVDAPTHEALKDAVFKGDTAFISNWQKGMRILHLAQTAPASAQDRSAAIARAWWDYQRADRRGPDTPERPYSPPPPPREQIPASVVESLLNKQVSKIPLESLTLAERALAEQTRGFSEFALPRLPYYTAVNRMERITGGPVRTPDPIIQYVDPDPPNEWLDFFMNPRPELQLTSSIPEKPDLTHLDLAPAVPFLADLAQKSAQITQKSRETKAGAALQRYLESVNMPGDPPRMLDNALDPEAGAAGEAYRQAQSTGAPLDPAALADAIEKVQKESPYLDPKERYKFFKSASTTGIVLAPIIPVALAVGMEGALVGALAMGAFEALGGMDTFVDTPGRAASKLLTGDPGGWDAYIRVVPHVLLKGAISMFDPQGTEQLAKYDSFWRDSLPVSSHIYDQLDSNSRLRVSVYTESMLRHITSRPPGDALVDAANALGLSNPYVQKYFGDIAENDLIPFVTSALGMHAVFSMARGFKPLPTLRTLRGEPMDPMLRFTPEELLRASSRNYSPLGAAMRAPLLQVVTQEIHKLPDAEAAHGLVRRLTKEMEARGPMDSPLAASAWQALEETRNALTSLTGAELSTEAKLALAKLPPVLADLGPTEGWYAATGKVLSLGKAESTRTAELLKTYLDRLELNADAAVPGWVEERFGRNLPEVIDGLRTEQQRKIDFVARGDAIIRTLTPLLETTQKEATLGKMDLADYVKYKATVIQDWNNMHLQAAAKLDALANGTPLELPRPNAAAFTRSFHQIFQASADGKLRSLYQKNPKLFEQVYGELAPKYRSAVKRGQISEADLTEVTDAWLNDNLRPERQTFTTLDELKKARGFSADPRAFSPASLTPERISQKITKALADGEPISLGDKEHELLNLSREVPVNPKKAQGQFHNTLNSMDATAKQKATRLEETKKFATSIEKFIEQVRTDPDKPRKMQITRPLLAQIEGRLREPEWLVADFDRTHVSWVPELSLEQRTGLEVFQEATSSLSAEIQELRKGLRRYGSLEQAAASISNPTAIPYLLRQHLNTAAGMENWFRFRWQKTAEIFKDQSLSAADFQKLQVELSSDTIPAGDLAGRLWQAQQRTVLEHSYLSGLLPESEYQRMLGNRNYFHSTFEDQAPVGVPKNALPTARLAEIKTDPNPFKAKIPHDSWYLEFEVDGRTKRQAGFKDEAAAQRGLEKLNPSLPLGTKVAIRAPYTLSAREVAGEIVDAGYAGYDLTDQLGLNIAHAYMNRSFSSSKFALHEFEAARLHGPAHIPGENFVDEQGTSWFFVKPQTRAAWLTGKYVSGQMVDLLKSSSARYGWLQRMADELQSQTGFFDTITKPASNPLFTLTEKAAKSILGVKGVGPPVSLLGKAGVFLNNLFSLSRLALSLAMPTKQASSNWLFNMPLMGINPSTPFGAFYSAKYFMRFARLNPVAALDDFALNSLVKNGNIEHSRLAFNTEAAAHLEKHWNSLAGLEERLARAKEAEERLWHAPEAVFRKEAWAQHLHMEELKTEITKKTQENGGLFGVVIGNQVRAGRALLGNVADLLTGKGGGGPLSKAAADWVGMSDNFAKYAAHAFNMEVRGMSEHQSLAYIDAFGQNLQRVPEAIRSFSKTPLATRFSSYPVNFYTVAANAIKYRSNYVMGMMGALATYNLTTLFARGEDPREYFTHYARINKYGHPSAISDAMSLLTSIQLPNGGALDLNSIYGPFEGQSPVARRLDSLLTRASVDPLSEIATKAVAHVASKFVGSNPFLSMFSQLTTGLDQRNRPMEGFGGYLRGAAEVFAPDWFPGSGRDAEEVTAMLSTSYKDPYTGEQKSKADYVLKQLISYIPPGAQNSPARLRAATDSYLFQQPAMYRETIQQMIEDSLPRTLWAEGAYHDDDTLDMQKARPITEKWYQDPRHVRQLVNDDGSLTLEKKTPGEISEILHQLALHPTTQIRGFSRFPFNVQLDLYAMWRQEDAHPDPKFHAQIVAQIASKVLNSHPEVTHLATNEIPFTRALLESPDLPPDAKSLIQGWLATAVQHAIKSEMDRAGKAPPVR